MGGAEKPNNQDFVVIRKGVVVKQVERVIEQMTRRRTSKWQTQEQKAQDQMNADEIRGQLQAFQLEKDEELQEQIAKVESGQGQEVRVEDDIREANEEIDIREVAERIERERMPFTNLLTTDPRQAPEIEVQEVQAVKTEVEVQEVNAEEDNVYNQCTRTLADYKSFPGI